MNTQRNCLYIQSEGPNKAALARAFKWLFDLNNSGFNINALIATPVNANLDGIVKELLGEDIIKTLIRNETVRLSDKLTLQAITQKDKFYQWDGYIIAIYPTKELLDKIDGLNASHVLVVPWLLTEVDFWIKMWNAQNIDDINKKREAPEMIEPIMEIALNHLNEMVNVSTGISHPSDHAATAQLFEILLANGIKYDTEQIRSYLIANLGWKPKHADDVVVIADKILSGRKVRYHRKIWREDIFNVWLEELKKK